jgi:hypothetical protein
MTALYQQTVAKVNLSAEEAKAILAIDAKLRKFVADLQPLTLDARLTFHNRPAARVTLGVGTGVVLWGASNKARVKLSDGKLVSDPLPRQLTMVVANVSFKGYDPVALPVSPAERYRAFAGAILSPDFGVGGGITVLLARGLAVNFGGCVLFSRAAEDADVG